MTLRYYIVRQFATMVVVAFAICAILIFMIDFVELLREAGKGSDVGLGVLLWLAILRLPAYSEILLTFAVLVGSIASLLMMARKSELAVMRAGGLSAWGLISPCVIAALVLGVFSTTIYNPVAAAGRARAEVLFAEAFGKNSNFLRQSSGVPWLRQDSTDGPSVIAASAAAENGVSLLGVRIVQFDEQNRFVERIDAKRARLWDGFWLVEDGWVSRVGHAPKQFESFTVATYLSPERVKDAFGSIISLSFWELPTLIDVVERAGLSAAPYHVQYQLLWARPFLLAVMVLLAATVSLKSFRSGGIQTMVVFGMVGGIGFFLLAEVSRQVGVAGLVAPWVAVWVPVSVACLVSATVLLYQEDG
ncbi:MAG: LPS export ABC transporter permease LptG [Hyphomicrobiaceae bacterium]